MPVVTIQRPRARVALTSERLEILLPAHDSEVEARHQIPLADIERLAVPDDAIVSTPALCALLERRIPVCFLDRRGVLLGSFEPPGPAHAQGRLAHYRMVIDPARAVGTARALVAAKISNARRLLQRVDANHPCLPPEALPALEQLMERSGRSQGMDELRGCEGAAAAAFYESWARFLPTEFPFERRTRRPPHNPVNAVLSYLATLLHGEILSACHAAGLDPALGCLHVPEDGRWSLALDLMEPFRPVLVESLTLRLFALRVFSAGHFEPREGGIYLTTDGRRQLWQHYEQRLLREFFSEHAGHRTTLRRQIQDAPVHFKTCLEHPELFRPFRLN